MARMKSRINDEPPFCFTSMIDVVFLLLIFFLLQPIKAPEKKLPNELPKDVGPGKPVERMNLRLVIRASGEKKEKAFYQINNTPYTGSPDRMHMALLQAAKNDTKVPVAIAPDPKVHFFWVLKALDQCAIAGLADVTFEAPVIPGGR